MIDINRHNYEEYFLDFREGELSPREEKSLMLFLNENPDLKIELELFKMDNILADNIYLDTKKHIKKEGILFDNTLDNFDELCIARIEGDLNKKEIIEFDKFIIDNEKRGKEYNLYRLTKNKPDEDLIFQDKEKLKRREESRFVNRNKYPLISIAASIIVLIALYLFIPKAKENNILIAELEQDTKVEILSGRDDDVKKSDLFNKETIKNRLIETNDAVSEQVHELTISLDSLKNDIVPEKVNQLARLKSIEIKYDFNKRIEKEDIIYIDLDVGLKKEEVKRDYISIKTYLAEKFNSRVLKKEHKNTIEFFDIAQAGIEGINKFTGSNMSLERLYDVDGSPNKTEFCSRLLAFSTPIKKE